ncbi:hypothetical protein FQN54_006835 [Arachnomyces sp. PD_36]|nr:hypothetical protein FQN54_006835 [Arachnomyces sp. PD_36]
MAAPADMDKIYSATYSSVPVYEFKLGPDNVMRRRSDDWINATHILKAAGLDKPARTRILERDVQKGVHEKVQGGYGKYQGIQSQAVCRTWVPLQEGRNLAERNGILEKLRPIFDFVPGDRSPPPAPKHTTATGSRQKTQKLAGHGKKAAAREASSSFIGSKSFPQVAPTALAPPNTTFYQEQFDHNNGNSQFNDDESMGQATLESSSMIADEDMAPPMSQQSTQSRKRKRDVNEAQVLSLNEQEHILYGDELLDYFMTVGDAPGFSEISPPEPPANFQVDKPIDDQGNTALHWACAMGDLEVVRDLINRGANVHALSTYDETPLVRAVLFTNNYEKQTMPELVNLLRDTITFRDWFGATIFHHLAETTRSKGKWKSAKYYAEVLANKLHEMLPQHEMSMLLSCQDSNQDTAVLVSVRNGCLRLASLLLLEYPDAGDQVNKKGETANGLLRTYARNKELYSTYPAGKKTNDRSSLPDDNTSPTRQPASNQNSTSAPNSALVSKIESVLADAGKKLSAAYGNTRLGQDGAGDVENPQGLFEHVEADRKNIREQTEALAAKQDEGEQVEAQLQRYDEVRKRFESYFEQTQHTNLQKRFQAALELEPESSSSSKPPSTPAELTSMYHLALELSRAQQARRAAIHELTQQRADAGVSTKLDVHRRLVSLATGLREDELDPMSAELAETLEFDRKNERMTINHTPEPDERQGEHDGERDSMEVSMARSALAVDAA